MMIDIFKSISLLGH